LALCLVLLVLYLFALIVPSTREFFAVSAPKPGIVVTAAFGAVFAIGVLWLTDERFVPWRWRSAA
jgi:hypothetical protein